MRNYLVEKRNELKLTQQDVAKALGISRQYYNAIENEERQKKMEITLITGLSKVLDIPIATIIENESAT